MGIDGSSIKQQILLRTDQQGLSSPSTNKLIDTYIDTVLMEIAAKNWYRDLLHTEYLKTDQDGKFSLEKEVIPFLMFLYGSKEMEHSWQRVTPIDYEYFESWKSRVFRGQYLTGGGGAWGGVRRRYTILPQEEQDTTLFQILEKTSGEIPVKIVYYPIRPSIDDFPTYFTPLIVNKVLELLALDREQGSGDRFFKQLQGRTEELEKLIKKQAKRFEVGKLGPSRKNKKTEDWLESESNDIGFFLQ